MLSKLQLLLHNNELARTTVRHIIKAFSHKDSGPVI